MFIIRLVCHFRSEPSAYLTESAYCMVLGKFESSARRQNEAGVAVLRYGLVIYRCLWSWFNEFEMTESFVVLDPFRQSVSDEGVINPWYWKEKGMMCVATCWSQFAKGYVRQLANLLVSIGLWAVLNAAISGINRKYVSLFVRFTVPSWYMNSFGETCLQVLGCTLLNTSISKKDYASGSESNSNPVISRFSLFLVIPVSSSSIARQARGFVASNIHGHKRPQEVSRVPSPMGLSCIRRDGRAWKCYRHVTTTSFLGWR